MHIGIGVGILGWGGATVVTPTYLLKALFSEDNAAPLTSPFSVDVGALTLSQVDGELSTAGGVMVIPTQTTPAYGDLGAYDATARTRACGLALIQDVKKTGANTEFIHSAWQSVARVATGFGDIVHSFYGVSGFRIPGKTISSFIWGMTANLPQQLMIVLRNTGAFYIANGGGYAVPTLIYVDSAATTTPLYFGQISSANTPGTIDNVEVVDIGLLDSRWATDDGICTQVLSGARSASDAISHAADFFMEFTVTTLPSAGNLEIQFRKQDANNYWQVFISNTGAITLNEVVAGTPTPRGTGTGVANGNRFVVMARGEGVWLLTADVVKVSHFTAANFKTQTSGVINSLGTGGAISTLKTFPVYPEVPSQVVHPFDGLPTGLFTFLPVGDSKAATWPTNLSAYVGNGVVFIKGSATLAVGGQTVAELVANIDANLSSMTNDCNAILWNMGTNDAHSDEFPALVEATWKADVLHCWDALHAKWPSAQFDMMYIWRRAFPDDCDVINGWYADLLPLRPFVSVVADERIWLENGDDGATYTSDGTHYSTAGNQLAADLWRAGMDY